MPVSAVIKLSSPETRQYWEIPVLHEDASLLAIDKPSRLLTSPDRYDAARPNLMRLLHRDLERGAPWAAERGLTYLANAHRLDLETSGVLLLAKSKAALISLADAFGAQRPRKTYVALVQGLPPGDAFEVDAKLAPHPTRTGLMRVDPRLGKRSRTSFEVVERFRHYTLVHAHPTTGRTHQIRVHLRHAGFPIVGDALYGGHPLLLSRMKTDYRLREGEEEKPLIGRVALHALRLSLAHPDSGEEVSIEAPWPKDLTVGVKYLRKFDSTGAPAAPVGPVES